MALPPAPHVANALEKQVPTVPGLSEAIQARDIPLSVVTRGGGLVFVSGLPPIDPATGAMVEGDIRVQTRQVLENVAAALAAAGSSVEKVLKVTVYCTNTGYFEQVNAVYREMFAAAPPARTFVAVGSWPFAADIEIEAIALA
ncbi:Rid family hydrolase [Xanthobacter sp. ZOL 2024]